MKQGNIYYTDKDFTDLEVSTTFKYPCMLILKNAENEIVKIKETQIVEEANNLLAML